MRGGVERRVHFGGRRWCGESWGATVAHGSFASFATVLTGSRVHSAASRLSCLIDEPGVGSQVTCRFMDGETVLGQAIIAGAFQESGTWSLRLLGRPEVIGTSVHMRLAVSESGTDSEIAIMDLDGQRLGRTRSGPVPVADAQLSLRLAAPLAPGQFWLGAATKRGWVPLGPITVLR